MLISARFEAWLSSALRRGSTVVVPTVRAVLPATAQRNGKARAKHRFVAVQIETARVFRFVVRRESKGKSGGFDVPWWDRETPANLPPPPGRAGTHQVCWFPCKTLPQLEVLEAELTLLQEPAREWRIEDRRYRWTLDGSVYMRSLSHDTPHRHSTAPVQGETSQHSGRVRFSSPANDVNLTSGDKQSPGDQGHRERGAGGGTSAACSSIAPARPMRRQRSPGKALLTLTLDLPPAGSLTATAVATATAASGSYHGATTRPGAGSSDQTFASPVPTTVAPLPGKRRRRRLCHTRTCRPACAFSARPTTDCNRCPRLQMALQISVNGLRNRSRTWCRTLDGCRSSHPPRGTRW